MPEFNINKIIKLTISYIAVLYILMKFTTTVLYENISNPGRTENDKIKLFNIHNIINTTPIIIIL